MDGGGARSIRLIENLYIPLSDGVRVAAKIWLPEDAEQRPVPAILEMIPYRKRDGTIYRDVRMHPWIAAQGYACVRVDIRGSGESEGLLLDEYLPREQQDGVEIIDWLSRQSWCSGKVGMTGISWGGFNALQLAALKPPALKAIITLCSTDDRYADDIHYMGGCLINENPLLERGPLHLGRPAAGPAARRRQMAGDLAGAAGGPASLARAMARPSAPRCLLEAWLRLRGLRRHRLRGLCHRRLGGQLFQCRAAAAGGAGVPAQGADRPLDPCLSASQRAGPGHRLSAGGGALVGSLAEGHRQRDHGRADVSRLDAGAQGAEALVSLPSRPLGGGGCLALAPNPGAGPITSAPRD